MGNFFKNILVAFKDIYNFFVFRKEMKNLDIKNDIEFRKLSLKRNWLGNIVYTQVDCTDQELLDANYSIYDLALNKIQPYIDFFNKLKWNEYLVPEISNIQEEDGEVTLSFLFLFIYKPIVFTFWKMVKFLISIGIIGVTIYMIIWWCIGMCM